MKYLDSYRDLGAARQLLDEIRRRSSRRLVLLEVCGGQAHNLVRFGIDRDLPASLELIHGPGCPVCAAPAAMIDRALAIAQRPGLIVVAPGELLRVPGGRNRGRLLDGRDRGADVRAVYTAFDALALARKHPEREVVMVAAGFETTAPAAAAVILEAERLGLENLSLLCTYYRLAEAVAFLLDDPSRQIDAVLAAGPVCAVTGLSAFEGLAERFRRPVVVTGPDPLDLLEAIVRAVRQLEAGSHAIENPYDRAVRPEGNPQARAAIAAVFEPADVPWRGLGTLPGSGLVLRDRFRRFDASARFAGPVESTIEDPSECPGREVLSGRLHPPDCPWFGNRCTPHQALGPFMVSAEGVCSAYYRNRRLAAEPAAAQALSVMPAPVVPGS